MRTLATKPTIAFVAVFLVLSVLAPAARAEYTYMFSKPVDLTVELNSGWKVAHHVWSAMAVAVEGTITYHLGGPAALAPYLAWQTVRFGPSVRAQSAVNLKIQSWLLRRGFLKGVENASGGIKEIILLTTGTMEGKGTVTIKQNKTGLLFVKSDVPLDSRAVPDTFEVDTVGQKSKTMQLGDPIDVSDLEATRLRMRLTTYAENDATWEASLKDVFERKPLPEEIAEKWRGDIDLYDAIQPWLVRNVMRTHRKTMEVNATLVFADGTERPLGKIMDHKDVARLVRSAENWLPRGKVPLKSVIPRRCKLLLQDKNVPHEPAHSDSD